MNGASRAVVRAVLNEGCEAYAVLEGTSFGSGFFTSWPVACVAGQILGGIVSNTILIPPTSSLKY